MAPLPHAARGCHTGSMTFGDIRAWFRMARLGLHLACGAAIITFVYPWVDGTARARLRQRWSKDLLSILHVDVSLTLGVSGHLGLDRLPDHWSGQGMLVSNHISWLDIFVVNSVFTPVFVCKDDVRRWPFIGWLCARNEAVFINRRRTSDARRVSLEIAEKLRQGMLVAVFPEGTTSEGSDVLPFRGALLQAAVDAGCPTLPLALRYLDARDRATTSPSYCGEATFWDSLCAIAAQPALTAEVRALPPIAVGGRTRRALALEARASIRAHLGAHRHGTEPQAASDEQLEPAVIFP